MSWWGISFSFLHSLEADPFTWDSLSPPNGSSSGLSFFLPFLFVRGVVGNALPLPGTIILKGRYTEAFRPLVVPSLVPSPPHLALQAGDDRRRSPPFFFFCRVVDERLRFPAPFPLSAATTRRRSFLSFFLRFSTDDEIGRGSIPHEW